MGNSFKDKYRINLLLGAAVLASVPVTAYAQSSDTVSSQRDPQAGVAASQDRAPAAEPDLSDEARTDDIIVTGTLLRGVAPVGSNLISVGQERVQSQGATTSNELLATIPQVSNLFNNAPQTKLATTTNVIQVVRPNLRNLTPETGSSSSTLVLFDGHRIAGVGVTQAAVDPDLLPSSAIERVEVVTDGGSATYGADAVGGVINFITRKRFDGIKADARYGFADNYHQVDASITAGKDWGSGSLFASYTYQHNTAIFGRDRDFIKSLDYATSTPTSLTCAPGNVTLRVGASNVNYALPGLAPNTFSRCDPSDDASFIPVATRHGGIVGLHQELSSAITVDLRAFYGERSTTSYAPLRGQVNITSGQAFYRPIAANPTGTQTVQFSFTPVLGDRSFPQGSHFSEWGTNAEFTADVGGGFQVRQLLNYSRSFSEFYLVSVNQTLLDAAGSAANPAAAVNFYDLAANPNLAVINAIANSEFAGQGRSELINARTLIDGSLFNLPGGEVRIAAGYEYIGENFAQRVAPPNAVRGAVTRVPYSTYQRNTNALFGEIQVPIFGADNRSAGLYSLVLAASARYDRFSDFGSTTNPKVGITYKPVSWLGLRGNYSTSFNAPSPVDQLGSQRNSISFIPFNAFVRPGDTPAVVGLLALQGSTPNLKPQTAKTYSFGADLDLPFLAGFHASVNYYHVKFDNLLSTPTPNVAIFTNFPNNVQTNVNGVSVAQLQAFGLLAPNGTSVVNPLIAANRGVYELIDFRVGNFGTLETSGLDFTANYRMPTGFGGVDAAVSGNYTLNRKAAVGPGAPMLDLLTAGNNPIRLTLQTILGADVGAFRAQATLNHTSGFDVVRAASLPQDRVGAFNTVNLFFKYDIKSDSILNGLTLTANVNNLFDQDPPAYLLNSANGYVPAQGFTLGRLIQFGVSKKF